MEKKLLKGFRSDISYYKRTAHKWGSGTVSFVPEKKDSDIVILQSVVDNCLSIENCGEAVEKQIKAFEQYIVKNFSKTEEGVDRPFLSDSDIDLTDDNIIELIKFNKEFKKELNLQKAKETKEKDYSFEVGV